MSTTAVPTTPVPQAPVPQASPPTSNSSPSRSTTIACGYCGRKMSAGRNSRKQYCTASCRQSAYRQRKAKAVATTAT